MIAIYLGFLIFCCFLVYFQVQEYIEMKKRHKRAREALDKWSELDTLHFEHFRLWYVNYLEGNETMAAWHRRICLGLKPKVDQAFEEMKKARIRWTGP